MRELALVGMIALTSGCNAIPSSREFVFHSASLLNAAKNDPAKLGEFITSNVRVHTQSKDTDASKAVVDYVKDCEFYDIARDEGQTWVVYANAECKVPKLEGVRVEGNATLLEKRTITLFYEKGLTDIWLGKHTPPDTTEVHVMPQ